MNSMYTTSPMPCCCRSVQALFNAGITLVATSNVAPDALYLEGLQRIAFFSLLIAQGTHRDPASRLTGRFPL